MYYLHNTLHFAISNHLRIDGRLTRFKFPLEYASIVCDNFSSLSGDNRTSNSDQSSDSCLSLQRALDDASLQHWFSHRSQYDTGVFSGGI